MTSPFRVSGNGGPDLSPLTKGVIPGCVGDRLHPSFLLYILELVFDAPGTPGGNEATRTDTTATRTFATQFQTA